MYLMLFGILIAAVITDLTEDIIPNLLVLLGAVLGIVCQIVEGGQLFFSLGDAALILLCLIPVYMIGGLGAGDVKLRALIPLYIGLESTANLIISAFLAGAVCSAIKFAYSKAIKIPTTKMTIHFTVPIFFGAILTLIGGIQWITI